MGWRGLGRIPGEPEPAFSGVGVVCDDRAEGGISVCGTGRPGADGEVGKGDIIEPEPFAENSRPGILDLNRGAAHGLVGEEERVKTGTVQSLAGLAGVCQRTASKLRRMDRHGLLP